MAVLAWSTIATIVYFSFYLLLLLVLAIYIHVSGEHENKKQFLKELWSKRAIYGQVLVHLYDTATDIGVLIEWGILAYDDNDYHSIDMFGLFWTSIAFLIAYRILLLVMACMVSTMRGSGNVILRVCFDGSLALLDMWVIKVVYKSLKDEEEEPSHRQKSIQLLESICESLPQVVLQSVFIIRGYNDQRLRDSNSLYLVAVSLLASLLSISNKYIWLDKDSVIKEAQDAEWKTKSPVINKWYVLRVIWRFSFVTVRFCALSLVWSVLGGGLLGIYLAVSWIYWSLSIIVFDFKYNGNDLLDEALWCLILVSMIYGFTSLIATPASDLKVWAILHGTEMIAAFTVITTFAFVDWIDCGICADPDDRQATNNPYILMFIIGGWVFLIIDAISYFFMLYFERVEEKSTMEAWGAFFQVD